MKKIIFVIVIAALVFLVPPFIVSKRVESEVQNFAHWISDNPGYSATVENVDTGLFSSKAQVKVSIAELDLLRGQLQQAAPESEKANIDQMLGLVDSASTLNIDIDHGLFLTSPFGLGWAQYKVTSDLEMTQLIDYVKQSAADEGRDLQLTFETKNNESFQPIIGKVGLTGTHHGYTKQPASVMTFMAPTGEKIKADFGTTDMTFSYDENSQEIIYDFDMSGMRINSEIAETELSFGEMTGNGEMTRLDNSLLFYLGSTSGTIKDIDIQTVSAITGEQEGFSLGRFNVSSETMLDDDGNLDFGFGFNLAEISIPSVKDLPVQDTSFSLTFKDITPDLRHAIDSLYRDVLEEVSAGPENMSEEKQQELLQRLSALGELFQQQPAGLALDIAANLTEGENIKADANLDFTDAVDFSNMQHPIQLIGSIAADVNAKMSPNAFKNMMLWQSSQQINEAVTAGYLTQAQADEALTGIAQQAEFMIDPYVQQGMIIKNDDGYAVEATLKEGKLTVNGNEMPLPF